MSINPNVHYETPEVSWTLKRGNQLSPLEIYEICRERNQVFTVEQSCLYQDADGVDLLPTTYHIQGWVDGEKEPVAYVRLTYNKDTVTIGRLLVIKDFRNRKIGSMVLNKALETIDELQKEHPVRNVILNAQFYLRDWYGRHGFKIQGEPFEIGNVIHIDMIKEE